MHAVEMSVETGSNLSREWVKTLVRDPSGGLEGMSLGLEVTGCQASVKFPASQKLHELN